MTPLETTIISSHIVRPSRDDATWSDEIKDVPLSILDNTCARFARSCATWIYEAPSDPNHFSETRLLASFRQTTSLYSFWSGQLHWTTYDPSLGYQNRHGRLALTYGGDPTTYPGFPITFVSTSTEINSILPNPQPASWAIDEDFPSTELIPDNEVALQDSSSLEGLPNLAVRVTRFGCGGVGVGIKMTHSLADATSLVGFMHDWSDVHTKMIHSDLDSKADPTSLDPNPRGITFNPSLLDSKASGNLSSPSGPDPALLDISRSLPIHRYDWLLSGGPGCPIWAEKTTICPPELDLKTDHSRARGERMRWDEWDWMETVRHVVFRFSPDEVERIWEAASRDNVDDRALGEPPFRLSRLDTLLAHIWQTVMRANQIPPTEPSYLDLTFGLRSRLSLPTHFLGSPLRQITTPGHPNLPLSTLSQSIRSTLKRLDEPGVCAALLHDLAYDTTGQNIWSTFLGKRHLLCTSWTRLGVYEVRFGTERRPRWVDAFMLASDGLLQVMEASPGGEVEAGLKAGARAIAEGPVAKWWKDGASVSLHLAGPTMERLIGDPRFRAFA